MIKSLKYLLVAFALVVASSAAFAVDDEHPQMEPVEQTEEAEQTEEVEQTEESDGQELYEDAEFLTDVNPGRYLISKINVYGVEMINKNILASSAGLNVGDSITLPSAFVSTAMQRLWNQRRYADVKAAATIEGDEVVIDLYLKEQRRVFNWGIEGLSKSKTTELLDKLKLRRNSELSEYVIDKNIHTIKEFYADKGFRNTEVDTRIENDSIQENMVNVTFIVDRKEKVKVGSVTFEGNEVFDTKRLRSTFKKTNQRSWNIFKSRKFNAEEYENDKQLLIDFYNSRGYRNATIEADSLYDMDKSELGIHLQVSEGNKYFIRDITWVGNSVYETEMLQRLFAVNSGDAYDKKTIQKRLGISAESSPDDLSVSSLYQDAGYLMSQIDPSEVIVGRDSIDLELKIFEGKPFTINNVSITGNMRVDDEVIRRELYTRPGELYNRSLLMQTIRTLGNIGHFNAEAIMPDIQPVTNSLVDIGWALEEQASDQFNIAGGWGGGTFVGSVGITLNNISIGDAFKPGAWRPYPMGKNQKLSVQAQSNGSYYKSFSASFTDPWMGGKNPNSFTVSSHYSDQNNAYYAWSSATQYFRSVGAAVGLGKRLSWPDPYFTLYGEFSYQRYMLEDWTSFLMETGNANLISAKVAIGRNSVDQQIYPRRGSSFSAALEITPPYSLFDGIDYSDDDLDDEDRYRFIEYHKWTFSGEWYQSFLSNSNLVLMLRAQMGYLGNYNSDKVSPFERFEVGGDGMSGYNVYGVDVIALRGYDDGDLDPTDSDYSIAYNKYTAELRYPIIMEPSSQIYVLAFLEAGNGFSTWRKFSPFDVKRSAGVGVRLYLPIVGMLGIDWGYGFDPASGSTSASGSQFHFMMGQQF